MAEIDIEKTWKEIYPYVIGRIRKDARCEDDAQSIASDVLYKIITGWDSFRGDNLISWALVITRNAITDYYRFKRNTDLPLNPEAHIRMCKDISEFEITEAVEQALNNAPPYYLESIILEFQGYNSYEAAEKAGITFPAHKSRLYRGLRHVRERLQEAYA